MKTDVIQKVLEKFFPHSQISVDDMTGTGDHFEVYIESNQFLGLSLIDQHQLVYKALNEYMDNGIHALKIKTKAL